MNRFVAIALACVLSAAPMHGQTITLHDRKPVTLRGILRPIPEGRLQFVAVLTREAYGSGLPGDAGKPQHAVTLSGYHDYAALYAHRGQAVTVRGTVAIDAASPYYRNGLLVQATSIRTAGGAELLGTPTSPPRVAADVGVYRASAVLPADPAAPWQYRVQDRNDAHGMIACRSNGAGDVVNCDCAEGFHATEARLMGAGKTFRGALMGWAQFTPPQGRVELAIACSR